MKGIYAISLLCGVAMLALGCASRPEAQAPAGTAAGQDRLTSAAAPAASPQLEREGFAVLDFRARRDEYDRVYVVGEVRNAGLAPRGVELQATLRDAEGRPLAVDHFCPASYRNILPDETWPFGHSFGMHRDAVKAELRIVGAFRTMDIMPMASVGR
jgi:hypothetical protein